MNRHASEFNVSRVGGGVGGGVGVYIYVGLSAAIQKWSLQNDTFYFCFLNIYLKHDHGKELFNLSVTRMWGWLKKTFGCSENETGRAATE